MKEWKQNTLVIIGFLLMFPAIYNLPFHVSYWNIKGYLYTADKKKVVVFYDSFIDSSHGETVINIFTSSTNTDYSILKIDNNEIRIETLELIVNNLISRGKEVYINLSIQPKIGMYASVFASVVDKISEDAIVTQSSGNNPYTPEFIAGFTSKNALEIDREIYDALNERAFEIKKISEDNDLNHIISLFGNSYASLYSHFSPSRESKMKELVRETIHPILKIHKLAIHEQDIVKLYASVILRFSYIALLEKISTNEGLIVVSSSSQWIHDPTDIYFLDCRINDLVQNKVRFPGVWTKNNEQIFGTSVSAPLALSQYFLGKVN